MLGRALHPVHTGRHMRQAGDERVDRRQAGDERVDRRVSQVCKLAYTARRKLELWVQESETFTIQSKQYETLGFHEGVGMLLHLGQFDINGEGRLTSAEYQDFCDSTQDMMTHLLGHISNLLVISTLILSISVPIMLTSVSRVSLGVALNATEGMTESIHGPGTALYGFLDQPASMLSFHSLECIFLSLSSLFACQGLIDGTELYATFSLYLPDVLSRLQLLVDKNMEMLFSMGALLVGIFFAARRYSPIAMICSSIPMIWFVYWMFSIELGHEGLTILAAERQFQAAKELMARETAALTATKARDEDETVGLQTRSKVEATGDA